MTSQKRGSSPAAPSDRRAANEPAEGSKAPARMPPLRPRPKLFILLWIVLLLWLAALVVMRLTTVHRPVSATPPSQIQR